jgi:hypothetical protein
MSDYVMYDIQSELDRVEVRDVLLDEMPDYSWMTGDSDAIGGYVSGRNPARVYIKIWTGQEPYEAAISYRCTTLDASAWAEATKRFLDVVASRIGEAKPYRRLVGRG